MDTQVAPLYGADARDSALAPGRWSVDGLYAIVLWVLLPNTFLQRGTSVGSVVMISTGVVLAVIGLLLLVYLVLSLMRRRYLHRATYAHHADEPVNWSGLYREGLAQAHRRPKRVHRSHLERDQKTGR
jgi:protein-S-isoprenylcysteine O-methyltransferase Ste14